MSLLGSGFSLREEVNTRAWTEDGDHERFAHYAPKNEVMQALVEGIPVMALCGKIWVPSRDPEKFPICPTCKDIYEEIQ